MNIFPDI